MPQAAAYNRAITGIPMPDRIRRLPVSPTGFPVPWFVTWFKDGQPCDDGEGVPDFRIVGPSKMVTAIKLQRCWICGQGPLGIYKAFCIGPMCSITKVISEPPAHKDCSIFAATACPFLANPRASRNEKGMYENGELRDGLQPAAGNGILRNPGAVCVWITKSFRPFRPPGGGMLFSLGHPVEVKWFAEGKPATRKQVLDSINSGYHLLEEAAHEEGQAAVAALATQRDLAMVLVPD